jgi:hypothetical protein
MVMSRKHLTAEEILNNLHGGDVLITTGWPVDRQ